MKMFRSCVLLFGLAASGLVASAHGQATEAANHPGILTVGVDLSVGTTDIFDKDTTGVGLYANYDLGPHLSADLDVHLQSLKTPNDWIENTYYVGPRYNFHFHHFSPYVKVLVGIGSTSVDDNDNYPFLPPPGSFFSYALGGGVAVPIKGHWQARVDAEQQFWPGFPQHGLTPVVGSIGIGYTFRP